jgi:hypothetical protein
VSGRLSVVVPCWLALCQWRSVVALLGRGAFGQHWLWCGDGCLVSVKAVFSIVEGVVLCVAAKVLCG